MSEILSRISTALAFVSPSVRNEPTYLNLTGTLGDPIMGLCADQICYNLVHLTWKNVILWPIIAETFAIMASLLPARRCYRCIHDYAPHAEICTLCAHLSQPLVLLCYYTTHAICLSLILLVVINLPLFSSISASFRPELKNLDFYTKK